VIRVLLVDDEPMFLAALEALLATDDRIHVVGMADTALQALEIAEAQHPDVALVDLAMPGLDGFELTRRLLRDRSAGHVLAVSGLTHERDAERALEAGASAFLLKGGLYNEVADAIVAASEQTGEARA
jgi:DNA-binding NarL/FixJ family response regulator